LGAVESGYTAKWFGPIASVVGGGVGTLLVVLGVMLKWPQVLRLGALHTAGREVRVEEATSALTESEQTPPAA
jgi:hypothetical protein